MKGMWERAGDKESVDSGNGPSMHSNGSVGNDSHFMSMEDDSKEATSASSRRSFLKKQTSSSSNFGTKESRAISLLKGAVFVVVLLAVSAVAAATYVNITMEERDNFEDAFGGNAAQIVSISRQKATQVFSALDVLSTIISSEAGASNTTWPLIFVPDWSIHAEKLGRLMGENIELSFAPIIQESERELWANFSQETAPRWYRESIENEVKDTTVKDLMTKTLPYIFYYDFRNGFSPTRVTRSGVTLPVWLSYPLISENSIPLMETNLDLLTTPFATNLFNALSATKSPVVGVTQVLTDAKTSVAEGSIMQPVFERAGGKTENQTLVGVALLKLKWIDYFENLLVEGNNGIVIVLRSTCPNLDSNGQEEVIGLLSYEVNGPNVTFLGEFDAHDSQYDNLEISERLIDLQIDRTKLPPGICVPTLNLQLYPTKNLEKAFQTNKAAYFTTGAVLVFALTSTLFLVYDFFVRRRQRKVMKRIARQELIVSNVFPTAIRDRLYNQQQENGKEDKDDDSQHSLDPLGVDKPGSRSGAPIADLFPNTTIVFADISGFTAWSSAREPQQVFTLLETIYATFDKVAHRHGIFKLETVGDSYVAVAGIPEPTDQHAVIAARFARDCMKKMQETVLKLEVTLGPDTADLDLRVGIHSGQVTAGVLRGERSRFQLFGDTMNTASRMESSGLPGRIQLTKETADLLNEGGLSAWVVPRSQKILVKGKGEMQTYWIRKRKLLKLFHNSMDLVALDETVETEVDNGYDDDVFDPDNIAGMTKTDRLVEWNVELLASLLQQIIASREGSVEKQLSQRSLLKAGNVETGRTVLDEFVPIIPLKRFDADELKARRRPSSIDIGEEAKSQLRSYLSSIASMYKDNPFHNFEHASHVTASVKKLLKRIVSVDENGAFGKHDLPPEKRMDLVDLAGHSYGITSDPLTQFAVVFSAIVHDVDHPGVPNAQLVKESTRDAKFYKKSVAEQNSVDLAWTMLMQEEYHELRSCIYQTENDLKRFRQLVVNTVLATDIVDKELQALRKARWETAFSGTSNLERDVDSEDRKATIVIEHLIQASDVVHTMQHWHIYKSWNEKFFCECYKAYKSGRADVDPSINWYKGEIGFFDFYVIPLAKKLDDCGVFGVSSHEYLNYATANRDEWIRDGEELVQDFLRVKIDEQSDQMATKFEVAQFPLLLEKVTVKHICLF
ncbi:unnamed protein product [Cylindrotheca closterium]|uniref:Phosphodiesterase n=1 Tax=Cylindrotheca closterium TaxID=2856 RepID=A0AAD2PWY1_9STRA|nr:unnamed protein product [Cylindrotheca closterium]